MINFGEEREEINQVRRVGEGKTEGGTLEKLIFSFHLHLFRPGRALRLIFRLKK